MDTRLFCFIMGKVLAVDNRCPHMGFPLDRGTVRDGILTCHWHHARFDLATGGTFDLLLIAAARYLAAHSPTVRAEGQTFHIARRLHRGEKRFEET